MYHSVSTDILVILDTVNITQLNGRFSHVPNIIREATAFRWDV